MIMAVPKRKTLDRPAPIFPYTALFANIHESSNSHPARTQNRLARPPNAFNSSIS